MIPEKKSSKVFTKILSIFFSALIIIRNVSLYWFPKANVTLKTVWQFSLVIAGRSYILNVYLKKTMVISDSNILHIVIVFKVFEIK